jgi:hypothetical protein
MSSSLSTPDPEPMDVSGECSMTMILKAPVSLSAAQRNERVQISHDN